MRCRLNRVRSGPRCSSGTCSLPRITFWYSSSATPKPFCRPAASVCSRSSARHKAWMVPRVIVSARSPSVCCSRAAISSAARLVNVTAQRRSGGMLWRWMRWSMRAMRQYVFPAPGPAMTRTGPSGASMARRCRGRGRGRGSKGIEEFTGLTPPPGRTIKEPMAGDDLSTQLARERALQQTEKMETIGRLTGAIARQFNELLGAILARTAAAAQAVPPTPDLDELKLTAPRGADLAQRLLGFSRHGVLELQPLILAEFVRDALDALRRQLPANIEVQFEADEDPGVVEVDPAAVKQIVRHLVSNALDAMPKGGTLHVEVRRTRLGAADRPLHAWVEPGSYVSVALSDTGVGMDAKTLARVFEPFFTTKPIGVGTGLGMSMAYGLVKQHRGYLHIYSEPGQGTTVKVYFPAIRGRGLAEIATAADEVLPGGTEAILLVEDDQTLRIAAQQLLSTVGYRLITAVDGQAGLDAFHAHRSELHLVITDVVMPKLSGFDMYETIRGESRDVRVLFMSGFPAPNFRKTVGRDPGVAFVTKPWTASEMLAQVRGLLEAAH